MTVPAITIALLGSCLVPALLQAQASLTVGGREVQIHGYLSEGFASSTDNNYLRMDTSRGQLLHGGGVECLLADHEQVPRRSAGVRPLYRRTRQGQSVPGLGVCRLPAEGLDRLPRRERSKRLSGCTPTHRTRRSCTHGRCCRSRCIPSICASVTVAHVGGDIYGTISTRRGGSLSYTGFAGSIPNDPRGGFLYGIQAQGGRLTTGVMGRMAGFDLRWNSPIAGLMMGTLAGLQPSKLQRHFSVPLPYHSLTRRRSTG